MRTLSSICIGLSMGLLACGGNSSNKAVDSTTTAPTDTSMHKSELASTIPPLPSVPAGAKVYFKNLKKGESVHSPVKIEMGLEGLKLDTAGAVVEGTGHHHLLIDAGDSIPSGQVIPKDEHHMHFGKAQSETTISLTPGEHRLTLQFADGIHRSYGSELAATIVINVKK